MIEGSRASRESRRRAAVATAFALAAALLLAGLAGTSASASSQLVAGKRTGSGTPVVLILLDELPTASLMTADGRRINRQRFPRIAGFADDATWYRDNVAGGDFTAWAVPSILTGNLSNRLTLPTSEALPDNIFTTLGPGRRVHSFETVTELCPITICPDGHQGEVQGASFANEFVKAKFSRFLADEIDHWIKGIPAGEGSLSFVHLKVPHLPLRFTPDGHTYPGGSLLMPNDLTVKNWTASEPAVAFIQQRHLLQAGFADRMVGRVLRKIRRNGDYERAMIVLTADHGVSFDPADLRRDATGTNAGATINPPLIIKYPGQARGIVSTASTQAIDIYPTVAKVLGASIRPTQGRPVGQAFSGRVMGVSKDLMVRLDVTAAEVRRQRKQVLRTEYRRLGYRGLWKLGPRSRLIGKRPGRVPALPGAGYELESPALIRRADAADHLVPSLVIGRLEGVADGQVVALAWNGKIVATTRAFTYGDQVTFGAMVPPAVMKRGRNRLSLYEVGPGNRLRRIG